MIRWMKTMMMTMCALRAFMVVNNVYQSYLLTTILRSVDKIAVEICINKFKLYLSMRSGESPFTLPLGEMLAICTVNNY